VDPGKHGRPAGIKQDMLRGNQAAMLGYRMLRYEPKEMCLQTTVDEIRLALSRLPLCASSTTWCAGWR